MENRGWMDFTSDRDREKYEPRASKSYREMVAGWKRDEERAKENQGGS